MEVYKRDWTEWIWTLCDKAAHLLLLESTRQNHVFEASPWTQIPVQVVYLGYNLRRHSRGAGKWKEWNPDNKMLYYYDCGQLELNLTGGLWDPEIILTSEIIPSEGQGHWDIYAPTSVSCWSKVILIGRHLFLGISGHIFLWQSRSAEEFKFRESPKTGRCWQLAGNWNGKSWADMSVVAVMGQICHTWWVTVAIHSAWWNGQSQIKGEFRIVCTFPSLFQLP